MPTEPAGKRERLANRCIYRTYGEYMIFIAVLFAISLSILYVKISLPEQLKCKILSNETVKGVEQITVDIEKYRKKNGDRLLFTVHLIKKSSEKSIDSIYRAILNAFLSDKKSKGESVSAVRYEHVEGSRYLIMLCPPFVDYEPADVVCSVIRGGTH